MKRRSFLATTAAASLARPAIAGGTKPLIFVPQANLTSLDPVWTTATVTRNFAFMVYDMLYGRDEAFVPRPQMVEGHVIDDDGKRWTMKLREGLLWHDGTPVLARDCLASLQRWVKRDAVGATINLRVDAIEASDDRTLVWRLRKDFPLLPHFLSKVQPQPVMMPERIASSVDPKEPLDKGGWSMFPAGAPGPEYVDPLLANTLRSNGAKAWFGWPDDPPLEAAYDAWADAPDDAERRKQEIAFQTAAFASVPSIPLGQYLPHAAWRSNITGLVKGSAPVFWGARKG